MTDVPKTIEWDGVVLELVTDGNVGDEEYYLIWASLDSVYEVTKSNRSPVWHAEIFVTPHSDYRTIGKTPQEALDNCEHMMYEDFKKLEAYFNKDV